MPNQELVEYINASRNRGMSDEQIMETLLGVGWQVHEIADIVLDRMPIPRPTGSHAAQGIISVRNISKNFRQLKALDNVSLDVREGSVTALLGPNGAGKTTLVRILTTLLTPSSGTVRVAGLDVVRDAQALRSIIGLAGQSAAVDEILTGRENIEMFARLYGLSYHQAKTRAVELLSQFDLVDAGDRVLKTYSGGMRRRLDLAASLIISPKVLFLDEPTTGLDPRSRFALWNVIRDLVRGGTTVLLTTQYLEEADQLADKVFVIDHGRIIAEGTPDELKQQVGGDILELHMDIHTDAPRAGDLIKQFGDEAPKANIENGVVTMPVSGGAALLVDVVRQLDGEKLKIRDVLLRRPSLDDVFMKLTGHNAEEGIK